MMTLKNMLIDYCKIALEDTGSHCQKERWAYMRFLRDVEREDTEEFPYLFDEEKAMNFLKWMSKFKHSKGVLAGKAIDPAPIQIFIFSNIYGWVHRETGYRRFKLSYWQVGRKNAKTQSNACVASYEASALGEPYSEVYIGATKSEQAKILWNETEIQIKNSPFFDKFRKAYGKIHHDKSGGFIQALSKDSGKTGDGFNPQAGLVDEYHAHQTSDIYDVLISGMGARTQPLLSIITTAGFELTNPCYDIEYKYVSKLLSPDDDVENEEYFAMVNELDFGDDIKDESVWIKANPILATTETGIAYLKGRLKLALDVPEKMRDFLTKNMNMWVDIPENSYLDINKWDLCELEEKELDVKMKSQTAICYIGADLSATTDLTSLGLIAVLDNKKYVKQVSFMPEDRYKERMSVDKVPYDLYVKQGHLILTEGSVVDYLEVENYILKWCEDYNVKEVCFDKWQAVHLMASLESKGITVVEIPQQFAFLSPATKDFRNHVYNTQIYHNGDKLLRRAIMNAKTREDDNENIMLSKRKSTGRIDPIACLMNAFSRANVVHNEVDLNAHILSGRFSF
ncbi:terminase large subunit [Granulicatella sp. zg-ZJ]|uniref:terminase large subunit n=1 Tax=Granulicatella sp. zg-ZJ TaxID=2678504 RepID=UPI0013D8B925|nr:terminase TerL endonuclease subunit [Granulicatella sp. zg-ZJ]NEW63466.1 terminase large subunit [Granulicatella sp. zg-ZJ]